MSPEQFAYWLQGCAELNPDMEAPSPEQWKAIKDHLKTVFVKVTPEYRQPTLGFPGIRSLELRPSYVYPGMAPVITC